MARKPGQPKKTTRVYNGKNGFTSTFTKATDGKWRRTGGTSKPPKKK